MHEKPFDSTEYFSPPFNWKEIIFVPVYPNIKCKSLKWLFSGPHLDLKRQEISKLKFYFIKSVDLK